MLLTPDYQMAIANWLQMKTNKLGNIASYAGLKINFFEIQESCCNTNTKFISLGSSKILDRKLDALEKCLKNIWLFD